MATEEVNKPLSLPPCPEMIMKALEALNEPSGSSKSAISKHIESTYGTVLSPPRPRGRPPKDPNAPPKSPKAKGTPGSGRPRGRPKKIARSPAVAAPTAVSTGRPRDSLIVRGGRRRYWRVIPCGGYDSCKATTAGGPTGWLEEIALIGMEE
ncbi:HMG-Y-related protein A [Spatholobus suberectus]|nr:HMG-Y-related protein A [Spatholobus suberectus]